MHRKGEYPIFAQLQEDGSYIKAQVNETYDFKRNENNLKRNLFGIEGTGEVGYSFNRIDVLLHIPISMVLPIYTKQKLLLIVNQKESQTSYR